jgi:hypothetical protein
MHTKFWSENFKGKPLRTPRHILKDNIKTDIGEDVDWISLAEYKDQWPVPDNTAGHFLTSLEIISF